MIATKNIRGLLVTNAFLKNGKFVEHYEWLREAARQQEIRLDLCDNAMLHAIYGMESDEAKLASYSFIIFWDKDIRLAKWMERYCQKRGIPIFNTPEAVAVANRGIGGGVFLDTICCCSLNVCCCGLYRCGFFVFDREADRLSDGDQRVLWVVWLAGLFGKGPGRGT